MTQFEVLIGELVTIDRLSASSYAIPLLIYVPEKEIFAGVGPTIALCEVSALDHEVLDHAVESRPLISESLFSSGQGSGGQLR